MTSHAKADMPLPAKLGRYELVGHLASGGMAEIFLGRLRGPRGFEHPVVIKRVLPALARTREFVDMFVDEANIVAAVRHPNVVAVHEFGHENDELFLVMEYLEGESVGGLARRLWSRGEALDRRLAAHILAEACAGLHAAHELSDEKGIPRDLVHRDVTPQNIFVTYRGAVKLIDFGIAKAANRHTKTEAGQIKGKFGYMSPEQCFGRPLDRRTDIFALGTLLYELTTSRRLFRRESDLETLKAITEGPVVPPSEIVPDYPPALEAICLRALQRRREDRYATAAEMRRDLASAIASMHAPSLAEEDLSVLMRTAFADRIEEKEEMLRHVRAGASVPKLPVAEADEAVEVPAIDLSSTRSSFVTSVEGRIDVATRDPSSRSSTTVKSSSPAKRTFFLAAGALAFVASVALVGTLWPPHRAAPASVASSERPVAPVVSAPNPVASEVSIRVETVPEGALLVVGDHEHGLTPLDLRIPRGEGALPIELRRDGSETWKQEVVPTTDQKIVVSLLPRPAASAPHRAPTAPRPARLPTPRATVPPPPPQPPAPTYDKL